MTKERKQEYTLKVSQANPSEMIVIIYEILLDYLKEAREAVLNENTEELHESIRKATACLRELNESTDLANEISGNLISINIFCIKRLSKAAIHSSVSEIDIVNGIIDKLYRAFKKAADKDKSAPVMNNTQKVYAGLTYGKESLVVNLNSDSNRGFSV